MQKRAAFDLFTLGVNEICAAPRLNTAHGERSRSGTPAYRPAGVETPSADGQLGSSARSAGRPPQAPGPEDGRQYAPKTLSIEPYLLAA